MQFRDARKKPMLRTSLIGHRPYSARENARRSDVRPVQTTDRTHWSALRPPASKLHCRHSALSLSPTRVASHFRVHYRQQLVDWVFVNYGCGDPALNCSQLGLCEASILLSEYLVPSTRVIPEVAINYIGWSKTNGHLFLHSSL